MPAQTGYYDSLKSVAGKVFNYLASITLTGTDGKTITCTQDTSLDEAVAMSSKATQTAWTDYFASSTITGWAASPTGKIMYKKIGSMIFVKFSISGTSNATTARFTLPVSLINDIDTYLPSGYNMDNGVAQTTAGAIRVTTGNEIYLYRDLTTGANWTNSGTKRIDGEFFAEVTP